MNTLKKLFPILLMLAVLLALALYGRGEKPSAGDVAPSTGAVRIEDMQKAHRVSPVGDFYFIF